MIQNDTTLNMGGIASLSILLASQVNAFRKMNGRCIVLLQGETLPTTVYYSYKSASVLCETIQHNVYNNTINFQCPKDRPQLFDSLLAYANNLVIILVTYSNGTQKVFGTLESPMLLKVNPAPQGAPQDYNGILFSANSIDYLPGRYGTFQSVPAPVFNGDIFTAFPPNYSRVSNIDIGGIITSDFSKTKVEIASSKLLLDITSFESISALCSLTRQFESPLQVSKLSVDFDAISSNGWGNSVATNGRLYVTGLNSVGDGFGGGEVIPSAGIVEKVINQEIYGYRIYLLRNSGDLQHFVNITSIAWE